MYKKNTEHKSAYITFSSGLVLIVNLKETHQKQKQKCCLNDIDQIGQQATEPEIGQPGGRQRRHNTQLHVPFT